MTTVTSAKLLEEYIYCEFSPCRRGAISYFVRVAVATVLTSAICSFATYHTGVPLRELWIYPLNFVVMMVLVNLFFFIFLMPVSVVVKGETIFLQEGRSPLRRRRDFTLYEIRAIRMVPFQPEVHGAKRRQKLSANHWILGGDKVLEIVLQDADFVIVVSPRADQLASLLHEMTRVPVEDCR